MNYYEKNINSFLTSVPAYMSAVYLPAFFISLINLLDDYFKFDHRLEPAHITLNKTTLKISYPLAASYFLAHLINIRKHIPNIKMAPTRGMTHDQRLIDGYEITDFDTASSILNSELFKTRGPKIIRNMLDPQNIIPVFEKRCPILQCKSNYIEMDIVAVHTLLNNSILYTKMGELICFQYLSRLSSNGSLKHHIEDYFINGGDRIDFTTTAKAYVVKYQENRCFYCGIHLDNNNQPTKPRGDHFIPWVFIKTSNIENLVYACHDCNSSKSDRLAAISYFNKMIQRNTPGSNFWERYPEKPIHLDDRVERWIKNYHQASEQLSTGWLPERRLIS